MKRIIAIMLMLMAATLSAQNYAWDTGKFAGATDMRGKGVVLVDSLRTTGVLISRVALADTVRTNQVGLEKGAGGTMSSTGYGNVVATGAGIAVGSILSFGSLRFYADAPAIYNDKTGVVGIGATDDTTHHKFNATGMRIGTGLYVTYIDTSAAGDSTKIGYLNGNKIMHFGTEVKAP